MNHKLTPTQWKSFSLINIGTVLEYFDFYIYFNIAFILNNVFFPSSTPYTKSLLLALSFSMSYILRPVGSLILGYIGDIWGRKATILFTTITMSIISLALSCMPTYDQIGCLASIAVLICRAIQGLSSAVELVGARVYVTELLKAPHCYFYATLVRISCDIGTALAMGCSVFFLYLNPEEGWRYVFLLGSGIAIIACISRTQLVESPEFLDAIQSVNMDYKTYIFQLFLRKWNNALAYFAIELRPLVLYFITFIYMGDYLIENYGQTPFQVLKHNFIITLASTVSYLLFSYLTKHIYPLIIMKVMSFASLFFFLFLPYFISLTESIDHILIIQALSWALNINGIGVPIFVRGFPVIGRYTIVGVIFSLARAFAAITTSYACVWLASKFEFMGITLLIILITGIHLLGLYKFVPCEEDRWIQANWKKRFSLHK